MQMAAGDREIINNKATTVNDNNINNLKYKG